MLVAALAYALTRRPTLAWAVFAVALSHLLFDAAGGSDHILYPFSGLDGLPWLACPLGALALFAGSAVIGTRAPRLRARLEPA